MNSKKQLQSPKATSMLNKFCSTTTYSQLKKFVMRRIYSEQCSVKNDSVKRNNKNSTLNKFNGNSNMLSKINLASAKPRRQEQHAKRIKPRNHKAPVARAACYKRNKTRICKAPMARCSKHSNLNCCERLEAYPKHF